MGGFANNAPIVTDGLVFYVDAGNDNSYPGSGTTWTDLIGRNDGTLTNGPTYSSGNGGSIVFDGSNDFIDCTSLIIPSNISICAFVKFDSATGNMQIASADGSPRSWQFRIRGEITNNPGEMIIFNSAGQNKTVSTSSALTTDTWYHLSGTYDSTNIKIYLNGVLENTTAHGTGIQGSGSSGDFKIGCRATTTFFDGSIPFVQLYDRALSSAEILQNYNALKNRFV